jgi:hypothetical protein
MTKTIDTLVDDIHQLFKDALEGKSASIDLEVLSRFGVNVANHIVDDLTARTKKRTPHTLYASEVGKPCVRQVWYGVHKPELGEKLLPNAQIKFLYGDCVEELVLFLAEQAGHKVELRQQPVKYEVAHGVQLSGRIDALIDGVLVDVKSCSPYGFKKFQEGLNDSNDSFGYRAQLASYNLHVMAKRAGFLAIDKQNGKLGWFEMTDFSRDDVIEKLLSTTTALKRSAPPDRHFSLEPEGKSGNEKLCMECSYCPYKFECWKDANGGAGLKAYAYSTGPVFLGTVVKAPKVPEIHPTTKEGVPSEAESTPA